MANYIKYENVPEISINYNSVIDSSLLREDGRPIYIANKSSEGTGDITGNYNKTDLTKIWTVTLENGTVVSGCNVKVNPRNSDQTTVGTIVYTIPENSESTIRKLLFKLNNVTMFIINLAGKPTIETVTVTWDCNGGKFPDGNEIHIYESVQLNQTVLYPNIGSPSKESIVEESLRKDYSFLGWFDAKTGGNKISEHPVITKEEIFYAQYKETITEIPQTVYHWYDPSGKELISISENTYIEYNNLLKLNDVLYVYGIIKCAPSNSEDSVNQSLITIENFNCTKLTGITKNTVNLDTTDRPGWLFLKLIIKESTYLSIINNPENYISVYPIDISFRLVYKNAKLPVTVELKLKNKAIYMRVSIELEMSYNLKGDSTLHTIEHISGAELGYTEYELIPPMSLQGSYGLTNVTIKKSGGSIANHIYIYKGTAANNEIQELGILNATKDKLDIASIDLDVNENIYIHL